MNDLDNVLYEIINEGGATAWQIHMIDLVHRIERAKAKQHPVGNDLSLQAEAVQQRALREPGGVDLTGE